MDGQVAGYPGELRGHQMSIEVYVISMFVFFGLLAGGAYLIYSAHSTQGPVGIDSGRRSLFARKGRQSGHALFFGLQIAVRAFGTDSLRSQLADLIIPATGSETGLTAAPAAVQAATVDTTNELTLKKDFLRSVSSLLIENRYAWEYGFWDYRNDSEEAIGQFNQWRNEIESSFATTERELGVSPDQLHRSSTEKELVIVSILILIDNREMVVEDDEGDYEFRPTYASLAAPFRDVVENVGAGDLWSPSTFERILEAIRTIDPRSIAGDAAFLLPGNSEDGISVLDLLGDPGWKYLTDHPIRST